VTASAQDWRDAAQAHADWVEAGRETPLWATGLRQQMYLGDERFVERMQTQAETQRLAVAEVPRAQPMPPHGLAHGRRRAARARQRCGALIAKAG